MTTPYERMRSLRWGHELLHALQADQLIPSTLQARAREIAARYPAPEALVMLLTDGRREFPRAFGLAVDDARALFVDSQRCGTGAPETRQHILYTLRHFPLPSDTRHAANLALLSQLSEWISLEERSS